MRRLASSLLAAVLGLPALAAADEIAAGVHLLRGEFAPGRQPDGNSVVIDAPDGLIVVDTGRHEAHTRDLLEVSAQLGKPIAAVINTHWHLDHVAGNALVRREAPQARIYASGAIRAARAGFLAAYREQLAGLIESTEDAEQRATFTAEMARIDAGAALEPDEVIAESGTRTIAGRELRIGLVGPAVTAGDLWILDPATGTLIAGDLVTLPVPFLDTACPSGWRSALADLAAIDFARLVPGHGPPLDRAQLARYRAAFDALLACAASDAPDAKCVEGWLAGTHGLIPASEHPFARSLAEYYVGQVLRGDPATIAARCGG